MTDASGGTPARLRFQVRLTPVHRACLGGAFWLLVLGPNAFLVLIWPSWPLRLVALVCLTAAAAVTVLTVRSPFTVWSTRSGWIFGLAAVPVLIHVTEVLLLGAIVETWGDGGDGGPDSDVRLVWPAYAAFSAAVPALSGWVAACRNRWLWTAAACAGAGFLVVAALLQQAVSP